jgi:hypothetical protein
LKVFLDHLVSRICTSKVSPSMILNTLLVTSYGELAARVIRSNIGSIKMVSASLMV